MRIQRHLIVAAARRMEASPRLADRIGQTLFNIHVNVFEAHVKKESAAINLLFYLFQPGNNTIAILRRKDPAFFQHHRVRDTARDILAIHPLIKTDGRLKLVNHLICRLGEAAAPELLAHFKSPVFFCMSARTLSGSPNRLTKPVPSA